MKRLARVLATSVIVVLLAPGGVGTAQAEQNNALTDDQYAAFGLNLPDASAYVVTFYAAWGPQERPEEPPVTPDGTATGTSDGTSVGGAAERTTLANTGEPSWEAACIVCALLGGTLLFARRGTPV